MVSCFFLRRAAPCNPPLLLGFRNLNCFLVLLVYCCSSRSPPPKCCAVFGHLGSAPMGRGTVRILRYSLVFKWCFWSCPVPCESLQVLFSFLSTVLFLLKFLVFSWSWSGHLLYHLFCFSLGFVMFKFTY